MLLLAAILEPAKCWDLH